MLLTASGVLTYHNQSKVTLEIGYGLSHYYCALIPKYHYVQRSKYASHVSIVRHETVKQNYGAGAGRRLTVRYDPDIKTDRDGRYWWLDVWSDDLCDLRVHLGLSPFRMLRNGKMGDRFHITVGNRKGILDSEK